MVDHYPILRISADLMVREGLVEKRSRNPSSQLDIPLTADTSRKQSFSAASRWKHL
jgi:hypothetical protein